MEVQIFGTKKSPGTRKALRFFSERRVKTHFVDLKERAPSRGELRRFVERFGAEALIDVDAPRYRELGLHAGVRSDEWWTATLAEEPTLLRTPLVRWKARLTLGVDERAWTEWLAEAG